MMKRTFFVRLLCGTIAAGWLVLALSPAVRGQIPIQGELSDYIFPDKDAQGRKTELKGARARTLPNGLIELEGMTARTFKGDQPDMTIEASHCLFDTQSKVAYSTGELSVKTADERFSIRGKGFRWQQYESRLSISNNVEAIVRTGLLKIGESTNAPAASTDSVSTAETGKGEQNVGQTGKGEPDFIEIRSDSFEYLADMVRFRGNVRASQQDAKLDCELVTAQFAKESGQLERVEASQNVVFERADMHAESDRALFLAKEDVVRLTGNASWRSGDRSGAGESIVVNNKTRGFRVEGGATVTLQPQSMLPLNWFAEAKETNSAPKALTISSDLLESDPRLAVFRGNVRVEDGQGGALNCGVMTNVFGEKDGKLTKIMAGGGVEFSQGDTRARSESAVYSAEENRVFLIGRPEWKFPQGEGRSDRLTINPETKQIEADQNVVMKLLAAGDLIAIPAPGLGSGAAAPAQGTTTNKVIQIFSDELYYKPGSAIFLNSIRVVDPEIEGRVMRCEVLAAFFAETDNKLDQLIAEENVSIQQGDMVAFGTKAVYRVPKGTIELEGNEDGNKPEVRTAKRKYTADRFVIDRSRQLFRMVGNWRVELDSREARAEFETK